MLKDNRQAHRKSGLTFVKEAVRTGCDYCHDLFLVKDFDVQTILHGSFRSLSVEGPPCKPPLSLCSFACAPSLVHKAMWKKERNLAWSSILSTESQANPTPHLWVKVPRDG